MSHAPNLLHAFERRSVHKHHVWRRHVVRTVSALFALVFLLSVALSVLVLQAGQQLLRTKEAMLAARDAAVVLDFKVAQKELEHATSALQAADRRLVPFVIFEPVPWIGTRIEVARDLVSSSREITTQLSGVLALGEEVLSFVAAPDGGVRDTLGSIDPSKAFKDLTAEEKAELLTRLHRSSDTWESLVPALDQAVLAIDQIPDDPWMAPIKEALQPFESKLRDAQEATRLLAVISRLLPQLAGLDQEERWLVLFLNNGELRPGGGFIGNYGTAKIQGGNLMDLRTQDIYRLDETVQDRLVREPPGPLKAYLGSNIWFLRDLNWSPDFATSSTAVEQAFHEQVELFTDEQRTAIQDRFDPTIVIGVTPTFAARILALTGPIEAGGQTFTSTNIFDTLEYRVEFGFEALGIPYDQRKDVISELVLKTVAALERLSANDILRFAAIVEEGLEQKHLIFHFEDVEAQKIAQSKGWGGSIEPKAVDHIMVVDANLASLKTDQVIDRDLTYRLFQDENGRWRARTSITYRHSGFFDWKTTRYRSFTRLYVPRGSELIAIEGSLANDARLNPQRLPGPIDQMMEGEHQVFGTFTALEPGTNHTLTFEFFVAPHVVEAMKKERYDLHIIKQIGVPELGLTLDIPSVKTGSYPDRIFRDWLLSAP